MIGAMFLVQLYTPVKFTSITCCHCSCVIFNKVESRVIPALFICTSIFECILRVFCVALSTALESEVLTSIKCISYPSAFKELSNCSPCFFKISQTRSEERRVGKEFRYRCSTYHCKNKKRDVIV